MIARTWQFVLDLFSDVPSPAKIPEAQIPKSAGPKLKRTYPVHFLSRRRRSWQLVKLQGDWICQAPAILEQAPLDIQMALQDWIHSALHPFPGSIQLRRRSQEKIFAWMATRVKDRVPRVESKGLALDIQSLFDAYNAEFFGGALAARVRWSPRIGGLSTHQALKTADGIVHLITISRAYDGADVPEFAVGGVLFHEMCHIAHPPRVGSGRRRVVHHQEFREAEKTFPQWEQWRHWERTHVHARLRTLAKKKRVRS